MRLSQAYVMQPRSYWLGVTILLQAEIVKLVEKAIGLPAVVLSFLSDEVLYCCFLSVLCLFD